jgi:26S proteasome regulatory subunit N7
VHVHSWIHHHDCYSPPLSHPQFLESYKSVTLSSMAAAFDVSPSFLDLELAELIVNGRLTAKIDKVAGVIETNRWVGV